MPYQPKNINATFKTALSTGKRWGYVERNAAKDATPPKQKKFAVEGKVTVEQSERLLKSSKVIGMRPSSSLL